MSGHEEASILVIEDEEELAEMYASWLEDSHSVETAYTGEEALSALDEGIDVVLLDRRLPGMSGGEVLEEIRDRGLDCRVALITAVDPNFDILDMEFDDYVIKPLLKDDLERVVDRLLALSTYDEQFRESFALAAKLSTLEAERTRGELAESEEYARQKERLERLREEIDETLGDFDTEEFALAYRELDPADEG